MSLLAGPVGQFNLLRPAPGNGVISHLPAMRDIHARVDDRSHRAIMDFAVERGVSVSALAEALARWITDNPGAPPRHLEKCIDQIVEEAGAIDAERRERRPK